MTPETGVVTWEFLALVVGVAVSVGGFAYWLLNEFKKVEARFDQKISSLDNQFNDDLQERHKALAANMEKLTERVTMMALAQSEHRAEIATNYLTRSTAEVWMKGLGERVEVLQTRLEVRLDKIDSKIEAVRAEQVRLA